MKYTILAAALALSSPAFAQNVGSAGDPAALTAAHKSGEMLVVHPANPPAALARNGGNANAARQMASAQSDPYPAGAKDQSDKDFSDTGNDGGK